MSTENLVVNRQSMLARLLKKTGRFYIPLIIAIIQLPFFPGAALGIFIIQIKEDMFSL